MGLYAQTPAPPYRVIQKYLDSITATDTFELKTSIPDCGEWGGHNEHIYLYKNKTGSLCYTFRVEDSTCMTMLFKEKDPDKFYYGISKKGSEKYYKSFLSDLYHYDMEKEEAWNAFYYFEIRFRGKLVGAHPTYAHWGEYEKLRKKVIVY